MVFLLHNGQEGTSIRGSGIASLGLGAPASNAVFFLRPPFYCTFILLRRIPCGLAAGMKAKGEPCEALAKQGKQLRKNENREIPRGLPRGAQMSFILLGFNTLSQH